MREERARIDQVTFACSSDAAIGAFSHKPFFLSFFVVVVVVLL